MSPATWTRRPGSVCQSVVIGRIPAGRFADPLDIARAVVLLSAPEAAFVTAQTLIVDGGYSAYGAAGPVPRAES